MATVYGNRTENEIGISQTINRFTPQVYDLSSPDTGQTAIWLTVGGGGGSFHGI